MTQTRLYPVLLKKSNKIDHLPIPTNFTVTAVATTLAPIPVAGLVITPVAMHLGRAVVRSVWPIAKLGARAKSAWL
jgi:hypothetical protein